MRYQVRLQQKPGQYFSFEITSIKFRQLAVDRLWFFNEPIRQKLDAKKGPCKPILYRVYDVALLDPGLFSTHRFTSEYCLLTTTTRQMRRILRWNFKLMVNFLTDRVPCWFGFFWSPWWSSLDGLWPRTITLFAAMKSDRNRLNTEFRAPTIGWSKTW